MQPSPPAAAVRARIAGLDHRIALEAARAGSFPGLGAAAQTLEDAVGVGADVLIGSQVESETHRFDVLVAKKRLDVGVKADRFVLSW